MPTVLSGHKFVRVREFTKEDGVVNASDFDQSCSTDSDCVAVVLGGDVCDPCDAPYLFLCPRMATVDVDASAEYQATISAAVTASAGGCGSVYDCGEQITPRCVSGMCQAVLP